MPSINTLTQRAPAEHVSLGSLIHPRLITYYDSTDHYSPLRYYAIAGVIASMMITFLGLYIGFKARLHSGMPLRPYEKYLFRSEIREHERKQAEALAAQEEARRNAPHAAAPVTDVAQFPSYPHHIDGSFADDGAKAGSVQESIKPVGEEALPVYEPPVGPPPPAVMR